MEPINNEKKHHLAKLTNKDEEKIRELSNQGMSQKDIAKQFNVVQATIAYRLMTKEQRLEKSRKSNQKTKERKGNTESNIITIEPKKKTKKEKQKEYRENYKNSHSIEYRRERAAIYNKRARNKKYKEQQQTPKEYISYGGVDKNAIRDHKAFIINNLYKKNHSACTMDLYGTGEGKKFLDENTKALVVTVDFNPKIAEELSLIPYARFAPIQTICKEDRKFDAIDGDYCGDLKKPQEDDISAMANIMKDKCILWLTLCIRTGIFDKGTDRATMEAYYEYRVMQLLKEKDIYAKRNFTIKYQGKTTNLNTGEIQHETPMKFYEFECKRIKWYQKWPKEITPTPEFITIKQMQEMDKILKNKLENTIIKRIKTIIENFWWASWKGRNDGNKLLQELKAIA